MPKKKPQDGKPTVHKELDGMEVVINEFGQIITNTSNKELNDFLNKEVDDKKLRDRDDLEFIQDKKEKDAKEASDTDEFLNEMKEEEE